MFSKKGEEFVIDGFGGAFASVEACDEGAELFLSGLADRVPLIEALFQETQEEGKEGSEGHDGEGGGGKIEEDRARDRFIERSNRTEILRGIDQTL